MSLFSREPLTALASFHLPPGSQLSETTSTYAPCDQYRLFPDDPHKLPDFIGQMSQVKSLFRTSVEIQEETSILLHKVGQYVILDQGPTLAHNDDLEEDELPLTLVPFVAIEKYLGPIRTPRARKLGGFNIPELPDAPGPPKVVVKNTFISVVDKEDEEVRPKSVPAKGSVERVRRNGTLPHHSLEELVVAESNSMHSTIDEILVALSKENKRLPPTPSRFGRAAEWRFGDYVILLGCDMAVYAAPNADYGSLCSFKLRPNGEFSARKRLDNWLENLMLNIPNTVWCDNDKSMYVERTEDLPDQSFDAAFIMDQSHRLFHFLKQELQSDCGTYWLFRERNSSRVDLYDLSAACKDEEPCTTSLRMPIASLCFRLARRSPDPIPLLRKGLRLLEPLKDEHSSIYSFASLELACLFGSKKDDHPPARLALALHAVERVLSLRSLDPSISHQAHVVHAETVLKIVREALIPLYNAALHCEWDTETKQAVSVAGLMNRMGWLACANASLDLLPEEQKQVEARVLASDVLEAFGDAAFALSCYTSEVHAKHKFSVASATDFLLERMNELCDGHTEELKDALQTFTRIGSPLERNLISDQRVQNHPLLSACNIWEAGSLEAVKDLYECAYKQSQLVNQDVKLRVGRKLAHVYNEEARKLTNTTAAVELFTRAVAFMRANDDLENAAVVLVNLANVHFQNYLTSRDYADAEKCIACSEEARKGTKHQRDLAFNHMRIAVALGSDARSQTHFAKALKNFHTAEDLRECAVCHFHMAEHALNARDSERSGLRHAEKSLEFWSRHTTTYPHECIQSFIQVAHFAKKPKAALRSLLVAEEQLCTEWGEQLKEHMGTGRTIPALRKAMGQICQQGLKAGNAGLKDVYRKVLMNESFDTQRL